VPDSSTQIGVVGRGTPMPIDDMPLEDQRPSNDAQELAGVDCTGPDQCSKLCNDASKWCVEHAFHPYKPATKSGDLVNCIDSTPSARLGGSYTCLYKYENKDVCIFSYGSRLGPIHLPAPRPLCVYKS